MSGPSPESVALQKSCLELNRFFRHCAGTITDLLQTRGLITEDLYRKVNKDPESVRELTSYLWNRMRHDDAPRKFQELLEALKQISGSEGVLGDLKKKYELCKGRQSHSLPSRERERTNGGRFEQPRVPDIQAYLSSLPPSAHEYLDQELDWDNEGVDKDLCDIADHMQNWEARLSTPMCLTHIQVLDIKAKYWNKPVLERRDALRVWKEREGLHATYRNLLQVFVEAEHTECAKALCELLKKKYGCQGSQPPPQALQRDPYTYNESSGQPLPQRDAYISDMYNERNSFQPTSENWRQPDPRHPIGRVENPGSQTNPESTIRRRVNESYSSRSPDEDPAIKGKDERREPSSADPESSEKPDDEGDRPAFKKVEERKSRGNESHKCKSKLPYVVLAVGAVIAIILGVLYMTSSTGQTSSSASTTRLTERDLPKILKVLASYSNKWSDIGLGLGFTSAHLSTIQATRPALFHNAPSCYLREMLTQWLQWAPGDASGHESYATLESLQRAVSGAGLGVTAEDLRNI